MTYKKHFIFLFLFFLQTHCQIPEDFEQGSLEEINGNLNDTLLSQIDRKFLHGMIRKYKPSKVIELGVCNGGSSAIILNALNETKDSHLYSIDILEHACHSKEKKVGWIVDERFPKLKQKWTLFTGGIAAKFIESIGGTLTWHLSTPLIMHPVSGWIFYMFCLS